MPNRHLIRRGLVLLTAAALAAGCTACASQKDTGSERDSAAESSSTTDGLIVPLELPDGISLSLPAGYETVSSEQYNAYSKNGDATVILTEEAFPANCDTLGSYVNRATDQYKAATTSFDIKAVGAFDAADTEGRYIEFSYSITLSGTVISLQCLAGYLRIGDTVYIITCKAPADSFEENRAAFHEILESAEVAAPDTDSSMADTATTQASA